MTPTQVWEDFNPKSEALQTSVVLSSEKNNIISTMYQFTSETTFDGKIRVFCSLQYKNDNNLPKPTLVVLPDLSCDHFDDEFIQKFLDDGYAVLLIDYAAIFEGKRQYHTTFPQSLDFAKADFASENLLFMKDNARETPWFIWAKICRRALTLAEELVVLDEDKLAVIGLKEGAKLAWILAAVDKRIKAAVPILGGGFSLADSDATSMDEERRVWLGGIGAETYARAVACPLCFVSASNNPICEIDKAGEMLDFVPNKEKVLMMSPRLSNQLTRGVFNSIKSWLSSVLKNNDFGYVEHNTTLALKNNLLSLKYKLSKQPTAVSLYYAYATEHYTARDWMCAKSGASKKDDELTIEIKSAHDIVAFANFSFKDNIVLSTALLSAVPNNKDVPNALESSRIVYDNSMGLSTFSVESNSLIVDDNLLFLDDGPFKIKGIATTSGHLVSYKLSNSLFAQNADIILQMDVFSASKRTLDFMLESRDDEKHYIATKELEQSSKWQRLSFVASDFKDQDNKSLTLFSETKKASFLDAQGVIFNNIIWL